MTGPHPVPLWSKARTRNYRKIYEFLQAHQGRQTDRTLWSDEERRHFHRLQQRQYAFQLQEDTVPTDPARHTLSWIRNKQKTVTGLTHFAGKTIAERMARQ
jgi:hypothetical protein